MAADSPDRSESSWATLIGIAICLSGNVVISFALNIQRLAHERIQRRRAAAVRDRPEASPATYGTLHPPKRNGDDGDDGDEDEENEAVYLRSKLWWTGLVLMAIGETGNFVACISSLLSPFFCHTL
jgi:magnesium transporter